MQHILSARQFEAAEIADIFARTDYMRGQVETNRRQLAQRHIGQVVATLFYEPSTRTRLSFEAAAARLGASVISTENAAEFSSAVKGESIEDTIRTVGKYADLVVLRHKETGAVDRAAAVAEVPIINAGDGEGEHPTQAVLDLYTIFKEKGRTANLRVAIGGDLVKGRTARSLALLLGKFDGNHVSFVSLPELGMGVDIKQHLEQAGTEYDETEDMYEALRGADVVYWTRPQLERRQNGVSQTSLDNYIIDQAALQTMKDDAIIMHPFPRNREIEASIDADSRAKYFDQIENGMYVRMALLDGLLKV